MALTLAQKRLQSSRHVVATGLGKPAITGELAQALSWIDQLWVPSTYVRDLIQPYTNKPIHVVPHGRAAQHISENVTRTPSTVHL